MNTFLQKKSTFSLGINPVQSVRVSFFFGFSKVPLNKYIKHMENHQNSEQQFVEHT